MPIYKGKGDALDCTSYRGIRLLEHSLKIVERILYNRLVNIINIGAYQFGFRAGKSTTDAIFIMRQLQEKYKAKNKQLHHIFVDLEKAFDRVPRVSIQWALRRQLVPEALIQLVMATYNDPRTTVSTSSRKSTDFAINVGVHQGSILSPLLFITIMEELTKHIRNNNVYVYELAYADDIVLTDISEDGVHNMFALWKNQLSDFGFKINIAKTKHMITGDTVMHQSMTKWPCSVCKKGVGNNSILCTQCQLWCHKRFSKTKVPLSAINNFVCPTCIAPTIVTQPIREQNINGIETIQKFTYLGDTLDVTGNAETAARTRISAAWFKYRQLSSILCRRDVPVSLRCKLYGSVIRPVMLYGAETWATTQAIENQIIRTDRKMLRWIHRISLKEHMSASDILERSCLCDIKDVLARHRLRWYGHVKRSNDPLIQSIIQLNVDGKRPRGRPQSTWWKCVNDDMKTFGVTEQDTMDRLKWKDKLRPTPGRGKWT